MKLKILFQNILKGKSSNLFDSNRSVNYLNFLKGINNLSLIQAFKIRKGDDKIAIANLEWIQVLYSRMIDKAVTNESKFLEYFKFQVKEQKIEEYPFGYLHDIGYRFKVQANTNYILINKLLQFIDSGYRQSIEVGNFSLAYAYLQVLVNWCAHLKKIYNLGLNPQNILTTLLNNNLSYSSYYLKDAYQKQLKDGSILDLLLYRGITNLIFDRKNTLSNHDLLEKLFDSLFDNLKTCLQNGQDLEYQNFIHRMMASSILPFTGRNFSEILYRLIIEKKLDLREELRNLAFLEANILFKSDLEKIHEITKGLLVKIENHVSKEEYDNIARATESYNNDLVDFFKVNQLKIIIFTTLAYAAFRKNYSLIETALKIHTPDDANATYGNHDLVDFSVASCLKLIQYQDTLEQSVTFKWDGHHGADIYLSVISVFYLAKSIGKSRNSELQSLNNYIETLDPEHLEWLKNNLQRIDSIVLEFIDKNKVVIPFIKKEQLSQFLSEGVKIIDNRLHYIIATKKLADGIPQFFEATVKEEFSKKALFRNVIPSSQIDITKTKKKTKGKILSIKTDYSRYTIREPFIENWHVPLYGFYENFSTSFAELEDQNVIKQLKDNLTDEGILFRSNIEEQISKKDINEEQIIVAINLSLYTMLYKSGKYKNAGSDSKTTLDNFRTGYFNGAPIYEVYLFGPPYLIILNRNAISTDALSHANLITQFIDINLEAERLTAIRPDLNVRDLLNNIFVSAKTSFEIIILPKAGFFFEVSDRS